MVSKTVHQNIIGIDILRALAALGVLYYHCHVGTMIAKYTGLSFVGRTDGFGAVYAVPLFFLISGYCIHASNIKYLKANSPLPLKTYYLRRFLRIYPPYLVAVLLAIVVNHFKPDGVQPTTGDLTVHLFSLQGFSVAYFNTINIVLWTISIELAFYAIYPLFFYARFKYSLNVALAFAFAVTCLSIIYFRYQEHITLPQRFFVLNLWFAWCCGAFLADKKMLGQNDLKQPVYKLLYLLIAAVFIYLIYFPNNQDILSDQFNILIWTAPLLLILSAENWLRKKQNLWLIKIIAAVGLSSYSLYLLHEPLIYLKNFIVHKYIPPGFQLVAGAIGIFLIPVIAWVSYHIFEKPFISRKKAIAPTA